MLLMFLFIFSNRLGWNLPEMIDKSIHLLSDGGLGMAMFSLGKLYIYTKKKKKTKLSWLEIKFNLTKNETGLFMASQSSIIACGTKMAIITMLLKFVLGPALMIASAYCIRLKSTLFKVAILQVKILKLIIR